MKILIPTLGRASRTLLPDRLSPELKSLCLLVVKSEEEQHYKTKGCKTLVCPYQGLGIAAVRQWILEWAYQVKMHKFIMADDDLVPSFRDQDLRTRLSSEEEIKLGLEWMGKTLDTYVHCSWSERSMDFDRPGSDVDCTRNIQWVGYSTKEVIKSGCRFNKDVPYWFFMEDYHMTLQLLRLGMPNKRSLVYRYSAGPREAPGGCSTLRTPEREMWVASRLSELHEGIVTPRFHLGRWNVKIQWKKAVP